MSMKESILNGIAKDCYNMGASIGADKDLILVNYQDFDKEATLSPFNRQLNDDFGNKGGLTDIILKEGAETYVFEGTDYSVVPSITTEIKENGNTWYSHSIAFTVYNKSSYARETLLMLGKSRVVAITRDRSTGLFEVFGIEQGLKMSGLDRAYTGAQSSNFYTVTIATPDIAVIREKSLGELSLNFNGEGGGGSIPPENNDLEYLLSLKEDKINKGAPNGYAPLDGNSKVPAVNLNIVNDLTTGGVTNLLSAEQGKLLGDRIESGLNNLRIERLITIEEPVTRLTASEAINNLPTFEVLDNEIPYFVTTNLEGEAGYRVDLVGLGKGTYGTGGTAIGATQVRISGLIDNGALGLNQILGLGDTGIDKNIILVDGVNPNISTTASETGYQVRNEDNYTFLSGSEFKFSNATSFGNAFLAPPNRIVASDTINTLPNVAGFLAVSVNGVFADANGNIALSSGGGEIPSWQQTLNVEVADVLVPSMKVSNDMAESYFALNSTGDPIAFQINTPKKILFDAGLSGKIELGNGLGILIDGKDKKVEIKADNAEGMLLDAGATGGISFVQNTGITLDARTQGLTLLGQTKGISIDSGLSLTIAGGLMTVNSLSQFNQKVTLKNSTGLTLNTNIGNFESSIKSDNVTKSGLIFQLPNPSAGTYTLATTADIVAPTLNTVLASGSIGTDKTITLNSTTDVNTNFVNRFDGFVMTNTVSGTTKKATLSIDSFLYENSNNNRKQSIDSLGIKSLNSSNNTYSQITPDGLFLQQNASVSTFAINLKGSNVAGSNKTIQLPNVNGTLTATVNGYAPDSNGNIILPIAGAQGLASVLGVSDSAGGLNIQDVANLELATATFNNGTATTGLKQKTGSTITGNLILPEKTGDNTLVLSVNGLNPNSAGLITLPITNFADGENLNVNVVPPTSHYTPTTSTLKGHLLGIDQALGAVVQTTAGITNRIYFTGDVVNVSGTNYYSSLANSKGTVSSVTQTVNNDDNAKSYFAQDVISVAQPATTTIPAGTFAGQLTVSVDNDNAQERFTVEVYKTNNAGTPIASGISGAPVGSLGVTVVAILDSGIIDLVASTNTNVSVTGALASILTLNTGERIRYHISAEKVGTAGGIFTYSLFFGTSHNSYYDIPVIATTDTVVNRSLVVGTTTSDALNNLDTNKANLAGATFTGAVIVPTPTLNTHAVTKAYADALVVGLLDDRGSYNASSNLFPTTGGSGTSGAVLKGDLWYVSVAGTLGGKAVNVGDSFRALVDSPAQVAGNWSLLSSNLGYVPANDNNVVHLNGSIAETITGVKTFNSSPVFASETASTLASFDGTKNLKSLPLATYPSLTEISYMKGVTSSVQTQLNGKQATLTNPVTGTGTTNRLSRWSSASTQTNSLLSDAIDDIIYQLATYGASAVGNESKYLFNSSGTNGAGIGARKTTTNTADLIMYSQFGFNNSTEVARFTSTGNMGINTTLPTAKLDILGSQNSRLLNVYADLTPDSGVTMAQGLAMVQVNLAGTQAGYALAGYNVNLASSTGLLSQVALSADTGTMPLVMLQANQLNNAGAGQTFAVNRPILGVNNYTNRLMTILANGNTGFGTSVPVGKLDLVGSKTTTYTANLSSPTNDFQRLFNVHNSGGGDQYSTLSLAVTGNNGTNVAYANLNVIQPTAGSASSEFALTLRQSSGVMNEVLRVKTNGNVGIGTNDPVGKLNINTGSINTQDLVSMQNGTISFANGSGASALPTMLSKSNDNVGLRIISGTNNTNANPDMWFDVRDNGNVIDFTTLTTSAFRFTRFNSTLIDVLRNGNTTFVGNITAPAGTTANHVVIKSQLDLKANSASPALTGTPTAPTATAGTNTTQIATTAFVLANAVSGTSGTYTPILTAFSNLTSVSLINASYTRVGNIVTVQIGFNATLTATGAHGIMTFTLPIARAATTDIKIGNGSLTRISGATFGALTVDTQSTASASCRIILPNTLEHVGSLVIQYEL